MARLPIKYFPDPILRAPTSKVSAFNSALHALLDNMYETMVHADGLGLAAPQVGHSERLAVIDVTIEYMPKPLISSLSGHSAEAHIHEGRLELINPHITAKSQRVASSVQAQDRHGRQFSLEAVELLSFALQHEIDHLDGVLFVDHLSRLKKVLFKKWCIKNEFGLEA
jgi:peptide deformylase